LNPLNFRDLIEAKDDSRQCVCGCTKSQLKAHIESLFKPGMSWGNYSLEWEIDHVTPVSFFEYLGASEEECHHFSNLQPLQLSENAEKSSIIGNQDVGKHPLVRERVRAVRKRHVEMEERWGEGYARLNSMTFINCGNWEGLSR